MEALRFIEGAARVSHRSEDKQTEMSLHRFLEFVVMDKGGMSVIEHVTATVEFLVDRGITHEIVRHRLFSFTQESTRFVNYAKQMPPAFIYPNPEVECPHCLQGDEGFPSEGMRYHQDRGYCRLDSDWVEAILSAEEGYKALLEKKWSPQLARSVFPNALAAKLVMTGNLRSWRHFLRMRTTKEAHPQMRQVTLPLLREFKTAVPILYGDIEPEQTQANNVRLPA